MDEKQICHNTLASTVICDGMLTLAWESAVSIKKRQYSFMLALSRTASDDSVEPYVDNGTYTRVHIFAFFVHVSSAIVAIAKAPNALALHLWSIGVSKSSRSMDFLPEINMLSGVNVVTYAAVFAMITAVAHILYALRVPWWKQLRWVEYSITSTLMLFILMIIDGIRDAVHIWIYLLVNVVVIVIGGVVEWMQLQKEDIVVDMWNFKFHNAMLIGIGWVLNIGVWASIFGNYITLSSSGNSGPWWVIFIICLQFVLFMSFAVVHLMFVMERITYRKADAAYIALSLTAKLSLEWMLIGFLGFA